MVISGAIARTLTSHVRFIKSKSLRPSCGGVDRVKDGRCVHLFHRKSKSFDTSNQLNACFGNKMTKGLFWKASCGCGHCEQIRSCCLPCSPLFDGYPFEMAVVAFSPTLLKVLVKSLVTDANLTS